MKSKIQERYMSFLREKGRMPKADPGAGALPEMHFSGGEVGDDDEEEMFHDDDWNNHQDTSGEPEDHFSKPPGLAFGGEIHPPKHGDEGSPEMSLEEVHQHLGKALMRRKQLRPGA